MKAEGAEVFLLFWPEFGFKQYWPVFISSSPIPRELAGCELESFKKSSWTHKGHSFNPEDASKDFCIHIFSYRRPVSFYVTRMFFFKDPKHWIELESWRGQHVDLQESTQSGNTVFLSFSDLKQATCTHAEDTYRGGNSHTHTHTKCWKLAIQVWRWIPR